MGISFAFRTKASFKLPEVINVINIIKNKQVQKIFFFMNKNYMQMWVMFSEHPDNLFPIFEFVSTCYECSNNFDHYLETS